MSIWSQAKFAPTTHGRRVRQPIALKQYKFPSKFEHEKRKIKADFSPFFSKPAIFGRLFQGFPLFSDNFERTQIRQQSTLEPSIKTKAKKMRRFEKLT